MGQAYSQVLSPPKAKWSTSQIPDLTGKVMIVTGSNSGIGKDTVQALLEHNAKVYLAARNSKKAEAAIQDLRKKTGKDAIFLRLDLADLKSVKAAAQEFMSKESELHVLFNNGGVMESPMDQLTAQGFDLQFGTNVIGHFYLTKLLLPVLLSGARSSADGKARIVHTSSFLHTMHPKLNFDSFKDGPARKKMSPLTLYAQSKFGNILLSNELARRYESEGIVSVALHPGLLKTNVTRHNTGLQTRLVNALSYPSHMGALTQLRAGTDPEGASFSGKYLIPWARLGTPAREAGDPALAKKLWGYMEEQVKNI